MGFVQIAREKTIGLTIKASPRGGGQDIATHFSNAHDNEEVEILEIRGVVADDLHGALAEIQLGADTLTKCQKPFYSVSANPDPSQGRWSREMLYDHRDRMLKALGLEGQPYGLVRHVKDGREHFHYVISRIDVENEKAIPMSFDYDKHQVVIREFSQDWGLILPEGSTKERGQHEGKEPLTLYEKSQQDTTGISKDERMAVVTAIWRGSDNPQSFVAGLKDQGYILCTGNRDYVLVDYYGGMNALPRLIDDKEVKVKQIREFLGEDFPKDQLPDVEETRQDIAKHRKQFEQLKRSEDYIEKKHQLEWAQKRRRVKYDLEGEDMRQSHTAGLAELDASQYRQRVAIRSQYLHDKSLTSEHREASKPGGLAAFFAKASGYERLQKQFQRRQDRRCMEEYQQRQAHLASQQAERKIELEYQQAAQAGDLERRMSALSRLEAREMRSLKTRQTRTQRIYARKGPEHMPTAALELSPWSGRSANIHKAKKVYKPAVAKAHKKAAKKDKEITAPMLKEKFKPETPVEETKPTDKELRWRFPGSDEKVIVPTKTDTAKPEKDDLKKPSSKGKDKGKTRK